MLVILFVTIVTVTILAINLDLKSLFPSDIPKTNNEVSSLKKEKRVTFNLNKNQIKLIPSRNKKNHNYQVVENTYIDYNDIPVIQKPSIVKDKVSFGNVIYGNGIIDNSNFFNSNHQDVPNIQQEFVDKLNKNQQNEELNEDLFKNQKGYWESQVIDDYTNREYSNIQIDNYNKFRNNNHVGEDISHVYDQLTGVHEKNGTFFGESTLRHDDNSVMGKMDDKLFGYDHGCNNMMI
jgi:hypothetical protein